MTVKLSEYGVRGPWVWAKCDNCGKQRSCLQWRVPDGPDGWDYMAECVMCLVRSIEKHKGMGGA